MQCTSILVFSQCKHVNERSIRNYYASGHFSRVHDLSRGRESVGALLRVTFNALDSVINPFGCICSHEKSVRSRVRARARAEIVLRERWNEHNARDKRTLSERPNKFARVGAEKRRSQEERERHKWCISCRLYRGRSMINRVKEAAGPFMNASSGLHRVRVSILRAASMASRKTNREFLPLEPSNLRYKIPRSKWSHDSPFGNKRMSLRAPRTRPWLNKLN